VAAIGMLVPAIFFGLYSGVQTFSINKPEHHLSLGVSIVLIVCYAATLIFQLRTHKGFFGDDHIEVERQMLAISEQISHGKMKDYKIEEKAEPKKEEEEHDGPDWSMKTACFVLLIATILVALMSEVLTDAVTLAGEKMGLSQVFMGIIIVAIVGNAAEHTTAVMMALKNKMDVAINIAFGSSLQISMFVIPVLVICSYARPGDPMDLLLTEFEVFCVACSVILAWMITTDGQSQWLEGAMLLMIYAIFAIGFFFVPAESAVEQAYSALYSSSSTGL